MMVSERVIIVQSHYQVDKYVTCWHVWPVSESQLTATISIIHMAHISKVFTVHVQFVPVSDPVRLYQTTQHLQSSSVPRLSLYPWYLLSGGLQLVVRVSAPATVSVSCSGPVLAIRSHYYLSWTRQVDIATPPYSFSFSSGIQKIVNNSALTSCRTDKLSSLNLSLAASLVAAERMRLRCE